MTAVLVSGGFDPLHVGHLRLMRCAAELGDKLVVVLNNDHWLVVKKGFIFMPFEERRELIEAYSFVSLVVPSMHEAGNRDLTICRELRMLRPNIFANGGDVRSANGDEAETCRRYGIEMFFGVGGDKIQSSSMLVRHVVECLPR